MEYKNTELINKRLIKSNEALLKALDDLQKLKYDDPNYAKKVSAISELQKQVVEDSKNEALKVIEAEKLRVEEEKTEMEKVLESERLDDERERSHKGNIIEATKIGVSLVVGVGGIIAGLYKFNRSTEKEKDEAYLTVTDKETVREGLREPTEKKWKFF